MMSKTFDDVANKAKRLQSGPQWQFGPKIQTATVAPAIAEALKSPEIMSAATEAGEATGGGWLAGLAKRLRADDRKTGELILGMFANRGLAGAADLAIGAAGLGGLAIGITFAAR
jgi:hypothetical protein